MFRFVYKLFIISLYNVYERQIEYKHKVPYGKYRIYKKGMINMKTSRKKLTMAIGMALGVTVLAGAAFANYNTSNGYDVGKTALKGLLQNENYTAETSLKFLVDGKEVSGVEVKELYDRNGDVKLNRTEKNKVAEEYSYSGGISEYSKYCQDNQSINISVDSQGEQHAGVFTGESYMSRGSFDEMNGVSEKEKETADKVVRFVELVGDTLVGDLKNNIVYVSGDENTATYEINLDTMQIPEMVNAGISAMFTSIQNYPHSEDPFMVFGTDPIIKNASLKFTVDNEGRLTDGIASATLSGEGHEGMVEISLKLYDYGMTQPERIDVSSLSNVDFYNVDDNGIHTYVETADGSEVHVTEGGSVVDEDGNAVGNIVIDENGEGHVTYDD